MRAASSPLPQRWLRAGHCVPREKAGSAPEFANGGGIMFRMKLEPGQSWHTCVLWRPILDGAEPERPPRACHNLVGDTEGDRVRRAWVAQTTQITAGDSDVTATVRQSVDDLAGLRMHRHDADVTDAQASGSVSTSGSQPPGCRGSSRCSGAMR